jgi:tRNA (guanine-N7-)-methyltransferase
MTSTVTAEHLEKTAALPSLERPVSEIELTYRTLEPPLCWENVFANASPIEVEIGFGKCGFLLAIAADHPQVNFLGIESSRKYYRKGVRKVRRAELPNVKLALGEARILFQRYFPDASVERVFVNFPDPWPKNRHAKRRLLQPAFLDVLARKVMPGGSVNIATDDDAYSLQIQEVFQADARYTRQAYQTRQHEEPLRPYVTEYEQMFLDEGKTIHYFTFVVEHT